MTAPYEVIWGRLAAAGVGVGCVTDAGRGTGVTVILLPEGARGSADVAGGGPATRETVLLEPENTVPGPDAIVFSGGSAFGLRTADGVMQGLYEARRGIPVGEVRVPIVVGAAIFDLDFVSPDAPTFGDGRLALERAAAYPADQLNGSIGAGTGAMVGKSLGPESSMKSGQGAVTLITADGLVVGALVVVNAVGSILDDSGRVLAGPRVDGIAINTTDLWSMAEVKMSTGGATTLAAVITNAGLIKQELKRVCRMAHDGMARAIEPVHTPWDGDAVFAVSIGEHRADVGRVGALAARAMAMAIRSTVGNEDI